MNLEDYQKFCRTTDLFPVSQDDSAISLLEYRTMCLSGEVGELAEKILNMVFAGLALAAKSGKLANKTKKIKRDSHNFITPKFRHDAISELGDMMWYISILCDLLDVSLEHILVYNTAKLSQRKEQDKIRGDGDER